MSEQPVLKIPGPIESSDCILNLSELYLVRYKRLKDGRKVIRSTRVIRNVRARFPQEDGTQRIDAPFDTKLAKGRLVGELDKANGSITLEPKDVELKGYPKGRGFEVVGYSLEARVSNANRRTREPAKSKRQIPPFWANPLSVGR